MLRENALFLVAVLCFLLTSHIGLGSPIEGTIIIEFFYNSKFCTWCPNWQKYYEVYEHNNQIMTSIQKDYEGKVIVKRIDFWSKEAEEKRPLYNLSVFPSDWNSIVVTGTKDNKTDVIVIKGKANETYIRELINYYLEDSSIHPPYPLSEQLSFMGVIMLAFSFGFFETFSPCLIIMLSFILSYTVGRTTNNFKEGFLSVMIFGTGFVSAALLLGAVSGLVFLSIPMIQVYLMWAVCIFAIFFGLNLFGLLKVSLETKPLIRKLARKYAATYTGMFILGFVFYFLDPCIAPIFVAMAPLLLPGLGALILFVFCLGVIVPFLGIGIFAGSVSKLVRSTYKHRFKIRAISGLILIGYAVYLITSTLLL